MKIENIHTDKEGLQKIIEFLHSDKNIKKLGRVNDEQFTFSFYLAEARTETPGSIYLGLGTIPAIRYVVSVASSGDINPPQPMVDSLCDLVKEVYKA